MEKSKEPSIQIQTDGGQIKETDQMGREKFWEDLGRPDDRIGKTTNLEDNLPMVNYIMLHAVFMTCLH
jgi:hypothetical protein